LLLEKSEMGDEIRLEEGFLDFPGDLRCDRADEEWDGSAFDVCRRISVSVFTTT
jgi:hypothetical protein